MTTHVFGASHSRPHYSYEHTFSGSHSPRAHSSVVGITPARPAVVESIVVDAGKLDDGRPDVKAEAEVKAENTQNITPAHDAEVCIACLFVSDLSPIKQVKRIASEIQRFHTNNPYDPNMTLEVEPAVFINFKNIYQDEINYKLEYYMPERELIVTWPTWVHESVDVTLGAFKTMAAKNPDLYSCLFNKNITIHTAENKSDLIPDFIFARCQKNEPWQRLIILEMAASQSSASLERKVAHWLHDPNVALVIGIDIKMKQYSSPNTSALTDNYPRDLTEAQFLAMEFPILGPIELNGHAWATKIESIQVGLYARPDQADITAGKLFDVELFMITPLEPTASHAEKQALVNRQNTLSRLVLKITREAVSADFFRSCFALEAPFDLYLDAFYSKLSRALRDDAFQRYQEYYRPAPPIPPIPPSIGSLKRARELQDGSEESEIDRLEKKRRVE
ncbi:hypothetical protein C8R43DRAFT_1022452 [Mycena crocata]|nr:hypothetical protein C8R43DRAFT_1022452 [Mycena crocata]